MFCTAVATRRPSSETSSTSSVAEGVALGRARARASRSCARRAAAARRARCAGRARASARPPESRRPSRSRRTTILPVEHALEHRAVESGRCCPAGRPRLAPRPAVAIVRRGVAFDEDDRRALERDEPAQLADEGAERLVELERRAERARAPVRRLEHVDAVPELVAQPLGLRGPLGTVTHLDVEAPDEPADDQPAQEESPDGNVTRSQLNAGGPNSRERHHSAKTKKPLSSTGTAMPPRRP